MKKSENDGKRPASEVEQAPAGWRRTAKIFWWLVLIIATAVSVKGNIMHADAVSAPEFAGLARILGGGSPIALLLMIEGVELGLLARAHGTARLVGLALVVPLAAVVFATSYAGLLFVVDASGLAGVPILRYSLAAVPDLLMIAATVYLLALRAPERPAASSPKSSATPPWRRIAEAAAARAEAALAVPPQTRQVGTSALVPTLAESGGRVGEAAVEGVAESRGGAPGGAPASPRTASATSASPSVAEVGSLHGGASGVSAGLSARAAGGSADGSASSFDPELAPYMEAASDFARTGVVTRKSVVEIARIIAAIEAGESDNAIKAAGLGSAGTAEKIRDAWRARTHRERNGAPVLSGLGTAR